MWHVRFGNKDDRAREMAIHLDRARFDCEFGDLAGVDMSRFDCVVPLDLPDYETARWNEGHWGRKYWSPHPDHVRLCDDKLALNRFVLDGEFAALVPRLHDDGPARFPYALKKRRDEWGKNSFVIRTAEDERLLAEQIASPDYFRQAYISGHEEYALHVLMVDTKVEYAQTVRYEVEPADYILGERAAPKTIDYLPAGDHLAIFTRLLASVGYCGTCCIDYKMHEKQPMLLEINPRIGASLMPDINRYLMAYLRSLGLSRRRVRDVLQRVMTRRPR